MERNEINRLQQSSALLSYRFVICSRSKLQHTHTHNHADKQTKARTHNKSKVTFQTTEIRLANVQSFGFVTQVSQHWVVVTGSALIGYLLKCVRSLGSERAQPVGLSASGNSMSGERPNLKP